MPTYAYECEEGHPYEEARGMSDPQQREVCPKPDCAKSLRRKFESSSILFKGRGFYSTGG
jgi:putative FmdB family regulatory protein